ncbi:MAG: Smr/MutS family protein, partial [Raineya sp.]
RQDLDQLNANLVLEEVQTEENEEIEVLGGEIGVGDWVRLKGQTAMGEVLAIRGKDAEVLMGELHSFIKLNRLEKISRKIVKNQQKEYAKKSLGIDMNEKIANFSYQIDLRGKPAEIALTEVDKFIDDALLAGHSELRILHGKGDGILRKLIREHLRTYPQVSSFASEHADRGGDGITIVRMK